MKISNEKYVIFDLDLLVSHEMQIGGLQWKSGGLGWKACGLQLYSNDDLKIKWLADKLIKSKKKNLPRLYIV